MIEKLFDVFIKNVLSENPKKRQEYKWRLKKAGEVFSEQMETNPNFISTGPITKPVLTKRKKKRKKFGRVFKITDIPHEVIALEVATFLTHKDLFDFIRVNREFNFIIDNNPNYNFWKKKFETEFSGYTFPVKLSKQQEPIRRRIIKGKAEPFDWKEATKKLLLSLKEIMNDWVNAQEKYKNIITIKGNELLLGTLLKYTHKLIYKKTFHDYVIVSSNQQYYFKEYIKKYKELNTQLLIDGFANLVSDSDLVNLNDLNIGGKLYDKNKFVEGVAINIKRVVDKREELYLKPTRTSRIHELLDIIFKLDEYENIIRDKTFILKVVRKNGMFLFFVHFILKNDKDVVMAAVAENGIALQYASNDLRKNYDVVMAAVTENGIALQYASNDLRKNYDVVMAAVAENGMALQYASNENFKNNFLIGKTAIENDIFAYEVLGSDLKKNTSIAEMVIRKDWKFLNYAPYNIKNNYKIVRIAMDQDLRAINYAGRGLINKIKQDYPKLYTPKYIRLLNRNF